MGAKVARNMRNTPISGRGSYFAITLMTTYSIRELIARLQDLADDGYKTLTDAELDEFVLGRGDGLSVSDAKLPNPEKKESNHVSQI